MLLKELHLLSSYQKAALLSLPAAPGASGMLCERCGRDRRVAQPTLNFPRP